MAKMLVSNEARKEISSLYRAFDEVNSILQTKFSQLDSKHEAANAYVDAAHCCKKTNTKGSKLLNFLYAALYKILEECWYCIYWFDTKYVAEQSTRDVGEQLWYTFNNVSSAKERLRKEEQEMLEREAAEAERKLEEKEKSCEITARKAAEKEAALARLREEKAMPLGAEPEKGHDVTQN